jgi:hypothetical protein
MILIIGSFLLAQVMEWTFPGLPMVCLIFLDIVGCARGGGAGGCGLVAVV